MNKIFIVCVLLFLAPSVQAIQTSFSDNSPTGYIQQGQPVKVYNSQGSLQYTLKKQSNGEVRQYSKTSSYMGKFRQVSKNRVKYYPR